MLQTTQLLPKVSKPLPPVTVKQLTTYPNHNDVERFYDYWATGWEVKIEDKETPKQLIEDYISKGYKDNFTGVFYNGKPAGFLGIVPADDEYNNGNDWETIIFIHPEYQRKHISIALNHSIARAARLVNLNLWAYVRDTNQISIKTHLRTFPNTPSTIFVSPTRNITFHRWQLSPTPEGVTETYEYSTRWLIEDLRWFIGSATRITAPQNVA